MNAPFESPNFFAQGPLPGNSCRLIKKPYPTNKRLKIPEVKPEYCINCGGCEYACPTKPYEAIYVDGNPVHKLAKKPVVKKIDEKVDTKNVLGYAAQSAKDALAPHRFVRRDPRPDDVIIEILYCGVCHSDLHSVRNDWGFTTYPVVSGHEIIGRVTSVGPDVTRFKPGDRVGVGCMVDSCRHCAAYNPKWVRS